MQYNYPYSSQYYANPYQARLDAMGAQNGAGSAFAPRYEIIHVNGKNGADALQMAPNSNVILMDDTSPRVFLKTTDGAGFPSVKGFKIIPDEEMQVDVSTLESRVKRLEDLINGYQSNGGTTKRSKSDADNATDEQK